MCSNVVLHKPEHMVVMDEILPDFRDLEEIYWISQKVVQDFGFNSEHGMRQMLRFFAPP